jgi:hypothetical protein
MSAGWRSIVEVVTQMAFGVSLTSADLHAHVWNSADHARTEWGDKGEWGVEDGGNTLWTWTDPAFANAADRWNAAVQRIFADHCDGAIGLYGRWHHRRGPDLGGDVQPIPATFFADGATLGVAGCIEVDLAAARKNPGLWDSFWADVVMPEADAAKLLRPPVGTRSARDADGNALLLEAERISALNGRMTRDEAFDFCRSLRIKGRGLSRETAMRLWRALPEHLRAASGRGDSYRRTSS